MQSILWCAWPPPGRRSTLKIACGSNIDDIRGNTTLVANCLYFQKISYSHFFEIFLRVVSNATALHQKKFIKIGHRTQKICSFQRTSPIFRVLPSTVKWIAQPDVDGTPLILHLLPINAGVKMQSILWCAWPPPGRNMTLKIASGSNIDDIRGNTTLVANCLYFQKI